MIPDKLYDEYKKRLDSFIDFNRPVGYDLSDFPDTNNREETESFLEKMFSEFPRIGFIKHCMATQLSIIREGDMIYEINPKEEKDVLSGHINILNEIE